MKLILQSAGRALCAAFSGK